MYTIFTVSAKSNIYKSTEPQKFFDFLKANGVRKIIDVRRGGQSRYSGCFQNKRFALLCKNEGIEYVKELAIAPQKELYKQCNREHWNMIKYAKEYLSDEETVGKLKSYTLDELNGAAFFCAENELRNCHRWICAEAEKARFPELNVVHLGLMHYKNGAERQAIPIEIEAETRAYIRSKFC